MALPNERSTPELQALQVKLKAATSPEIANWPQPTKDDLVIIGGIVVLYSYIDLNLRRIVEVLELCGRLDMRKRKMANATITEVERAILSLPDWAPANRFALGQVAENRGIRNLVAHFAVRRFPADNAFVLITKSARDFKREFGYEPEPGEVFTAILQVSQLRELLRSIEGVLKWLSVATKEIEAQWVAQRTKRASPDGHNPAR